MRRDEGGRLGDPTAAAETLLLIHVDTGHSCGSLYLGLGQRMAEQGVAFLTANRRGHDHVAKGVRGGTLASYAFESVHGSRADFVAWLELLRQRGHRRMAIGGHSGGAVRATCVQATERFDSVVAVMPVSPGEYTHEGVIALHGGLLGAVPGVGALRCVGKPDHSLPHD